MTKKDTARKRGKPGRPPKDEATEQITVRLPVELIEELKKEAAEWVPPLAFAPYVRHLLQARPKK